MNQVARMNGLGLAEARSGGACRQAWSPNRRDCALGGAGGGRGSGGPQRGSEVRVGASDGFFAVGGSAANCSAGQRVVHQHEPGRGHPPNVLRQDASGSARPRRRFGDQGRAAVASTRPPRSLTVSGRHVGCTVHLIACAWLVYTTRQMPDPSDRSDAMMTCTSAHIPRHWLQIGRLTPMPDSPHRLAVEAPNSLWTRDRQNRRLGGHWTIERPKALRSLENDRWRRRRSTRRMSWPVSRVL